MDELKANIDALQALKADLDKARATVKPLQERYDALREAVQHQFADQHISSLKTELGSVALSERRTIEITDEAAVVDWLHANHFRVEEYRRLDPARVQPLVMAALERTGEIVPGTRQVVTSYVSVKPLKERAA